jgi:hypothetical protein
MAGGHAFERGAQVREQERLVLVDDDRGRGVHRLHADEAFGEPGPLDDVRHEGSDVHELEGGPRADLDLLPMAVARRGPHRARTRPVPDHSRPPMPFLEAKFGRGGQSVLTRM